MSSTSDKRKERNCALSAVQGIFLESELLLALHYSLSMFLIMFSVMEHSLRKGQDVVNIGQKKEKMLCSFSRPYSWNLDLLLAIHPGHCF